MLQATMVKAKTNAKKTKAKATAKAKAKAAKPKAKAAKPNATAKAKAKPSARPAKAPVAKAKTKTKPVARAKAVAKATKRASGKAAKPAPASSEATTWKTTDAKPAKQHKPPKPPNRTLSGDDILRRMLVDAGWRLTTRGEAASVAEYTFEAHGIELKARGEGDRKQAIYLTLTDDTGRKLTLKIPMSDNLEDVLGLITMRQDAVDASNYSELINDIVKMSPGTQGLRDGELIDLTSS